VNADLYINGDVWRSLSPGQQKAIEVASNASLMKTVAYRITENGKALKDLVENHGVILHDTPKEYFTEYSAAAMKNFQKNAAENAFFKKVWDSQKAWADVAIPYWARAQKSNSALSSAYAETLKKAAAPAAAPKK
jgi:TRAP-type mannitol/chloroaromatic compound transport system substrate-binding protein